MSSTYTSLHIHFIFGTKHRDPCIEKPWRQRLHEYLAGTARGLGCMPLAVGGVEDHVHALLALRTTHTVAAVMREIKKASSIMVHNEIQLRSFAWQEGYAAIAVSPTAIASVRSYIENQEKHHRHKSFDEELEEIFKAAGMPFESGVDMR
jgi:putative transposase